MATKPVANGSKQERMVDEFNRMNQIGASVKYWRGDKTGQPSGIGITTSNAHLMGGHTAVVWIKGCAGCISLTHVERLESFV